jgi:hypothetical protein
MHVVNYHMTPSLQDFLGGFFIASNEDQHMTTSKIASVWRSAVSAISRMQQSVSSPLISVDISVDEIRAMAQQALAKADAESVEVPLIVRIRAEELQEDDVLIETWAGLSEGFVAPLVPGLVLFIHVAAIADGDEGVEVLHSRWTHVSLPEDPDMRAVSASAPEGVSVYPRGTFVTAIRGIRSIPVANLYRVGYASNYGPS